jgi:hypothetical protein
MTNNDIHFISFQRISIVRIFRHVPTLPPTQAWIQAACHEGPPQLISEFFTRRTPKISQLRRGYCARVARLAFSATQMTPLTL